MKKWKSGYKCYPLTPALSPFLRDFRLLGLVLQKGERGHRKLFFPTFCEVSNCIGDYFVLRCKKGGEGVLSSASVDGLVKKAGVHKKINDITVSTYGRGRFCGWSIKPTKSSEGATLIIVNNLLFTYSPFHLLTLTNILTKNFRYSFIVSKFYPLLLRRGFVVRLLCITSLVRLDSSCSLGHLITSRTFR